MTLGSKNSGNWNNSSSPVKNIVHIIMTRDLKKMSSEKNQWLKEEFIQLNLIKYLSVSINGKLDNL